VSFGFNSINLLNSAPGILHHESAPFGVTGERTHHGKLSREPSKEVTAQSLDDIKEFVGVAIFKFTLFLALNCSHKTHRIWL
jgi:hypothetical protein